MKVIFLFLLFLLPSWVYAADSDAQNFLSDVEKMDNLLRSTLQGALGSCEYIEEEFWSRCDERVNEEIIFGSFSQQNSQEAYVNISRDCGKCSIGLVFRQEDGNWRRLDVKDEAYFGDVCLKFVRQKSNDLLVCVEDETHWTSFGSYFLSIYILDFSANEPKIALLSFINAGKQYYMFNNWSRSDFDNDGNNDLYIEIDEFDDTQIVIDENTKVSFPGIEPVNHSLIWLFDGETFTPTPETKTFLDTLEQGQ